MSKVLLKTYTTKNHKMALRYFRDYNSDNLPNYFATIAKQKGGDNTFTYVVKVYFLDRTKN